MSVNPAPRAWIRTESPYMYIRIHCYVQGTVANFDAVGLKQMVVGALTTLHGQVGAADTVDVLAFTLARPGPDNGAGTAADAILRVPAVTAARVQAALTVVQQHNGKPCTLTVTSRAGALIALAADSRLMSAS